MSEREELEAVIARAVQSTHGTPADIATAIINSGYTQGNGELVEAVRECVAYFEVMNVTGSLPDQCRKALPAPPVLQELHGDGVRDDTEAVQERVNAGLTIGDSHE